MTLELVQGGSLAVPWAKDKVVRRLAEAGHHPQEVCSEVARWPRFLAGHGHEDGEPYCPRPSRREAGVGNERYWSPWRPLNGGFDVLPGESGTPPPEAHPFPWPTALGRPLLGRRYRS